MRLKCFVFLAVAALFCAYTAAANAVSLGLDLGNTSVTLQIQIDGFDEFGEPLGTPVDILVGVTQEIPLTGGSLDFDDAGASLSNLDGSLDVQDPWLIPTILGSDLSVAGGHLSIGDGPNGPFAVTGTDVDLGGLPLVLDGGVNTVLFAFDFGAAPVTFNIPLGDDGSWDGTDFVIPTVVSDSTVIDLFGNPALLIYTIGGQVAFTVPEPSSMILLGIACAVLPAVGYRRLRRRS